MIEIVFCVVAALIVLFKTSGMNLKVRFTSLNTNRDTSTIATISKGLEKKSLGMNQCGNLGMSLSKLLLILCCVICLYFAGCSQSTPSVSSLFPEIQHIIEGKQSLQTAQYVEVDKQKSRAKKHRCSKMMFDSMDRPRLVSFSAKDVEKTL